MTRDRSRGGGGETKNDGKKEKILFMIAGKIIPSFSCYNTKVSSVFTNNFKKKI